MDSGQWLGQAADSDRGRRDRSGTKWGQVVTDAGSEEAERKVKTTRCLVQLYRLALLSFSG
ncbi:MAG: hypothetical protein AAF798_18060 [Bacteroidota bacterium]